VTGEETTYPPLAHFPKSMVRHRGLQKGNSGAVFCTCFLQIGQRSLIVRLRGMSVYFRENCVGADASPSRKQTHVRFRGLNELSHQVVIVRFRNLATVKLSRRGLEFFRNVIDEHLAVNFRSVHLSSAFQKQLAFIGFTFEQ